MTRIPIREIGIDELETFLDAGNGTLIDVLTPEHYASRHIPGAASACVHQVVFLEAVSGLAEDKARPLVVYGAGGSSFDARVAADKLARAGYTNVAVFTGGLIGYTASGRKLAGERPEVCEPPHPVFAPEPREYALVPERSRVVWCGRNHNTSHFGEISLASGSMDFSGPYSGSMVLDMRAIRNRNLEGDPLREVLEAHLASDDFFFTSLFPTATFSFTSVQALAGASASEPGHLVQGELALRGVVKDLSFPAHFHLLEGGFAGLQANFDFDRTDWGVIYGSARFFHHLGMHLVFDHVSVDLRLVLQ